MSQDETNQKMIHAAYSIRKVSVALWFTVAL
jgi:hypothetical protein